MSSRTINRLATGVLGVVLAACGALPASTSTTSTALDTDRPETTTTVSGGPATTAVEGAITVVLRLPASWDEAVVQGRSDDFPAARLAWEASGSSLDVSLPGEGAYMFLAETPSSDDGLCFYQAQSDPQRQPMQVFDGDTVTLDIAGEVCE
jgi:hypothetical protein